MTETIKLGGREFTLRPPTLGQLRHLLDALDEMAGASGGALIDAAAKLVAAGLAAAHPEITVAAVLDCTATLAELNTAVAAILKLAAVSRGGRSAGGDVGSGENGAHAQLGALYAALATGCGYRYRDIDLMTLA